MKMILGTKIGMTQVISENGVLIPVTLIQAAPVTVTQVKTVETDGYNAVQVAYGQGKNLSNAVKGHLAAAEAAMGHVKKAGVEGLSPKGLREVRVEATEESKLGDTVSVGAFAIGDSVNVTGTSKGKGFAGNVKRNNFNTSKKTHGGNGNVRKPGSIGSMYPQKVFKGKRMAGRMGAERVTVKNLTVAYIDAESNLIGLKGAVPGPRKGTVMIGGNA